MTTNHPAVKPLLDSLVALETSATESGDELVLGILASLEYPLTNLVQAVDPNRTVETTGNLRALLVRSKLAGNEHIRA